MKIYYAHSQWKYGTKIEDYELRVIHEYFPRAEIINPAKDIDQSGTEEDVMQRCLEAVRSADLVVFSSVDGTIGNGVLREVEDAIWERPVLYLQHEELVPAARFQMCIKEASLFSHLQHADVVPLTEVISWIT